ncbi:MAG: hypothetical protein QG608_724 [Actinomycetota bacterium]|nr:hypothetical protein [Actinomycetota bacterium]
MMSQMMVEGGSIVGPAIVCMAGGAVFLALGLAHYAGFTKPVAFGGPFGPYLGLGITWMGGGTILSGLGLILSEKVHPVFALLLCPPGALGFVIGVVSIVWIPRFLRPAWLRDWVDRGKPEAEARRWPRLGR